MRVLIAATGSHGDVLPFIAIGRELMARGHDVRFYTFGPFERHAHEAGLSVRTLMSAEEYEALLRHPDATHPRKGLKWLAAAGSALLGEAYELMAQDVEPGNTLVVASLLSFPARLLRETQGVPTAVVHLAPAVLPSRFQPPRMGAARPPRRMPAFVFRALMGLIETFYLDPIFAPDLNRCRSGLGLAPVRRVFYGWANGCDLLVGLFPEWFAASQPDWPGEVRLTDFPLYDQSTVRGLPEELRAFLDQGAPPVAFTPGTATAASADFFLASAEACRQSGSRGILLTPYADQIPAQRPPGVIHCAYAPYSILLPRVAAFVHHGGIGSTSQALRAGVPQLIRPMAFDQFDNAYRAVQLGVAKELLPKRYRPAAIVRSLQELLEEPGLRDRCTEVAQRLRATNGISSACDLIVAELGSHLQNRGSGAPQPCNRQPL